MVLNRADQDMVCLAKFPGSHGRTAQGEIVAF
jgi:hypothetical protein